MSAFVFQWAMIPNSVPVAHQRCEAIADLMDHLRDLGLVLTGEPRAAIQHGRDPILALTCDVRDATDREAHKLAHRDADWPGTTVRWSADQCQTCAMREKRRGKVE